MSASPHVAIVGGGVAGLVAAREFARGGARVTLLEGERQLGGRIRATELAGAPFDMGAEAFATRGGAVASLLAELGLAERVVSPATAGAWVIGADGPLPLPPGGALGIPGRPLGAAARRHLGMLGAIRAAIEPLLPRLRDLPADTTVAALVRRRVGQRVCDRLVRPIALGVYSAAPEQLRLAAVPGLQAAIARTGSLVLAARELRDTSQAAGGAVASLSGGMTTLVDALRADVTRAGVDVRVGVHVASLAVGAAVGERWILSDATGEPVARCDGVFLAVPEPAACALVGDLRGEFEADQPAGEAAPAQHPIEVIALAVADDRLDAAPRGTGVLVAPGAGAAEPIAAKALTHVTAKWPDRAACVADGTHVVRLSYGRAGLAPETTGLDDEAALDLARRDASSILGVPITPHQIIGWARQPWTVGAPPSDESRLTAPAGIGLAGDWVFGTGLASVVPGARAAAAELLRLLNLGDGFAPHSTSHSQHTASTPESPVSSA